MAKLPEKVRISIILCKISEAKTEHKSTANLKISGKNFFHTLNIDSNIYVLSKKLYNI